jgi:phage shock protein A
MLKRLMNLFRGFLGLFITGLEKTNPRALIEVEKENLRKQIAQFNDSLASHAAFVERLMRQVKLLEKNEQQLTAKITANIKANNRSIAGQMALELKTIKDQLQENREQLTDAEETYKKLLKTRDVSVQEARNKIEKLKMMISEAEILEAQAELQEMATGMISELGGSGDTLNRLEEYLQERRDKAAGRATVAASSVDITEIDMKEAERTALADQALLEFETAYGLQPQQIEQKTAEPQTLEAKEI